MLVQDNLDLCCQVIEKAAGERAQREIDERLQNAYAARARAKAAGGAAPVATAKPAGGKPSTADILAAARAKGGAPAAKPAGDEGAKADPGTKPSTAEILARARAAKAATPPASEAAVEPIESVAAAPVAKPAATAKPAAGGALPTTTAEKLAWCRAHDAQG